MSPPPINPQLRRHRAERAFARNIARLWLELRAGTESRHLDALVELCESLLPACGSTELTERYRAELRTATRQVATTRTTRSHLRLV